MNKLRLTIYLLMFSLTIVAATAFLLTKERLNQSGKAVEANIIDTSALAPISDVNPDTGITNSDLYIDPDSRTTPLYTTTAKGQAAVLEFMQENPTVDNVAGSPNNQVQGETTIPRRLLPKDFDKNSRLIAHIDERSSKIKLPLKKPVDRYFYNQTIGNVPVLSAFARVDLQNDNQVVGVETNLLSDVSVDNGSLTKDQAIATAIDNAKKVNPAEKNLVVCANKTVEETVVSRKLLGFDDGTPTCQTYAVPVCSSADPVTFDHTYYVCKKNSQVVYDDNHVFSALNRTIKNCRNSSSCSTVRSEGGAATGDREADDSYNILGDVYNFYFNSLQRDSIDGHGMGLKASVHAAVPNAMWYSGQMYAATGWIANDIWAHEMTHGVIEHTARLGGSYQSGALNEGLADTFATGVDPDWTMGEASQHGTIRDMSNPPRFGNPDRLFSSRYLCSSNTQSGDYGGVHVNAGVEEKAFYLMTAGGSFNGCNITGIGWDKSLKVMYQAITSYLGTSGYSSNFKNFYDSAVKGCADLYGANSSECRSVVAAMQATEMDQQPSGTQAGPSCNGGRARAATCAGGQPEPTSGTTATPLPTRPGATTAPTRRPPAPTQPGTQSEETPVPGSTNTPIPGATDTPVPESTAVPTHNLVLNISLKFAGIFGPPRRSTTLPVRVTLLNEAHDIRDNKIIDFGVSEGGIWSGTANFDEEAGAGYCLLIKGPLHIQRKICHTNPNELFPGTYRTEGNTMTLNKGQTDLDFTHLTLPAGDLDQNGIVNSADIALVRNNLNTVDSSIIPICDVNYDGACTGTDYSQIIFSLKVRTDEE